MSQQIPHALISSLQNAKGFDEEDFIAAHEQSKQVVSIRLNPAKVYPGLFEEHSAVSLEEKVPWSQWGYYLQQRPSFTLDPLFHAGVYYVQEASSMFLEEAIRQTCDVSRDIRVLDLCAAPGGKSTLIQSVISEQSLLVSNEVIKARANVLVENIAKWGAANVVVTNNDPRDFKKLPGFFDLVVVDAPCSGSGLFRKDPAAINEWSLSNVDLCKERQQRILADIIDCLRPGGTLIYSTCSYSIAEDEDICDWLCIDHGLETLSIHVPEGSGIAETSAAKTGALGYRFYPHRLRGEGFFLAVFRKPGMNYQHKEPKSRLKLNLPGKTATEIAGSYIQNPGKYSFLKWNEDILCLPEKGIDAFLHVQANLYIKKAGLRIGSIIRDELIPDHELAVSVVNSEKIPSLEVDEATALDFLRRKDISVHDNASGWRVISFRKIALGLVKILPSRINNYYPKDWRILNK